MLDAREPAKTNARTRVAGPAARVALLLVLAGLAQATWAEPTSLTKEEAEALITGKRVEYTRAADGSTTTWVFSSGGNVFYATSKSQRNIQIHGTYVLNDDGSVCFKWDADKYIAMTDGCFAFTRDGATTHVVGARNRERIVGDIK